MQKASKPMTAAKSNEVFCGSDDIRQVGKLLESALQVASVPKELGVLSLLYLLTKHSEGTGIHQDIKNAWDKHVIKTPLVVAP